MKDNIKQKIAFRVEKKRFKEEIMNRINEGLKLERVFTAESCR